MESRPARPVPAGSRAFPPEWPLNRRRSTVPQFFGVVEGVLLKPLPYPHPEELVAVWLTAPGLNIEDLNPSPSDYSISREQNRTFRDIGMYGVGR